MPAPTPQTEAARRYAALAEHSTIVAAAEALGMDANALQKWRDSKARKPIDPAMQAAMRAVGTDMQPAMAWLKTAPDADGMAFSVMLKPGPRGADDFKEALAEIIESLAAPPPTLPPRFAPVTGNMVIVDPADVHIGKLSVATETGCTYNAEIAEHRLVEGCKALIEGGIRNGATHVLLVIGNDISHIDTPRRTTTSGTPQDTDGSIFTIFKAAMRAYARVVEYALSRQVTVQIVFAPSNHDWVLGYSIAQTLAARFHGHPNVTATEYAMSERHRKYVRYGRNLIGITHGDGAKEGDLPQIMLAEARPHIADCPHRYFLVHHYHHKIRKALGIRPMSREKDHIAMTVMHSGAGAMEGDNLSVEYVRSPSPPDGWHDRNGYLNRQAVEAFVHCPERGQIMRLTEWF